MIVMIWSFWENTWTSKKPNGAALICSFLTLKQGRAVFKGHYTTVSDLLAWAYFPWRGRRNRLFCLLFPLLRSQKGKQVTNRFNPLTPGTFCKKCVFWTFWWSLGWMSAKLPLIQSKMHLQHNSLPTSLGFSIFGFFFPPFLFLLFSSFCCSDWPSTGLACG